MKKRNVKILIIVAILILVCGYFIYDFYHPRIGSRSGRVIDAVSGKPIEGAVVNYFWEFGGFLGVVDERLAASYETITDEDGKYFIPSRRARRESYVDGSLHPESVIIYKDRYAVYTVYHEYGRSFGYLRHDQKYRKRNNLVKLYPWKDGKSHYKHMESIRRAMGPGWRGQGGKRLRKELAEERQRAREEQLRRHRRD